MSTSEKRRSAEKAETDRGHKPDLKQFLTPSRARMLSALIRTISGVLVGSSLVSVFAIICVIGLIAAIRTDGANLTEVLRLELAFLAGPLGAIIGYFVGKSQGGDR